MASSSTVTTLFDLPTEMPVTLKLRARKRRVRWAEDVTDNEDLGRKKSKCCCQYHKPRAHLDESSDEEGGGDECAFGKRVEPGRDVEGEAGGQAES